MIENRKIGLWILILLLTFMIGACSTGGDSAPTQAPPAIEATSTTIEPTVAAPETTDQTSEAVEPTEVRTEEPSEEPAEQPTDEPTEASPVETKTPAPEICQAQDRMKLSNFDE